MELHLKITAGLLLVVHALHLASLQDPTDSPGRTIDKSWLRKVASNPTSSSGRTIDKSWLREVASTPTSSSGRTIDKSWLREVKKNSKLAAAASGAEDDNLSSSEGSANDTSDDLNVVNTTLPPTFPNDTTQESEVPDTTLSPNNMTKETMTTMSTTTNSDQQFNMTETEEESHNSTTTPQTPTTPLISGNHTSVPDFGNDTDIKSTIPTPESNATQETTTQPAEDTGLTNSTGSTTTTTEKTPEMNETSPTSSPTTVFPAESTATDPPTTTAASPDTPEKANKTDKGAASGSSSERGLASDPEESRRNVQWGAVLGTAAVVAVVGLVAYIIMKKKHQKAFSHQKLVEEYHADPVLRLDNSEPLDLNYGGAAYYNPGLQGDSIQMSNFPGRHSN